VAPEVGRFAPSPTGPLHLGNLRTALIAWLLARATDGRFLVRMEDLDRVASSPEHAASQLRDLETLGLDWDGPVVVQSERFERYHDAIADLTRAGLTYECYCTRREIREAVSAPHGEWPEGAYPGTCGGLTRRRRDELAAAGRPAALRLRAEARLVTFTDAVVGEVRGRVDDLVIRRNDGVPAYNLAVIVDDAAQRVTQVVRGDDLVLSTPRQLLLAEHLGLAAPRYVHVALVEGDDGQRLAKRHGAVTTSDLGAVGWTPDDIRAWLAASLGAPADVRRGSVYELLGWFRTRGEAAWLRRERARARPIWSGGEPLPRGATARPQRP
jgi:glutamyl-tRNA synthetase